MNVTLAEQPEKYAFPIEVQIGDLHTLDILIEEPPMISKNFRTILCVYQKPPIQKQVKYL